MGVRSTRPESGNQPLELDTILSLASCTKLMTAIAALQCVEKGLMALDDDVSKILPELGTVEIITGIEEATGQPILSAKSSNISLR